MQKPWNMIFFRFLNLKKYLLSQFKLEQLAMLKH